jgi:hypothetical protein
MKKLMLIIFGISILLIGGQAMGQQGTKQTSTTKEKKEIVVKKDVAGDTIKSGMGTRTDKSGKKAVVTKKKHAKKDGNKKVKKTTTEKKY